MNIITYCIAPLILASAAATAVLDDDNRQNLRGNDSRTLNIFAPAPKDCDPEAPEPKSPWSCGSKKANPLNDNEIKPPESDPGCASPKLVGYACSTDTIEIDLPDVTTCGMKGTSSQTTTGTTHSGGITITVDVVTNWPTKGSKVSVGYSYEKSSSTCKGQDFENYNDAAPPNNTNGVKQCGTCVSFFRQVLGCAEVWEYEERHLEHFCYKFRVTKTCGDEYQTSNICNKDCN